MKAISIKCKTACKTRNSRSVHWICFRMFSTRALTGIYKIYKKFFVKVLKNNWLISLFSILGFNHAWVRNEGKRDFIIYIIFIYKLHKVYIGTSWCFLGFSLWFIYLAGRHLVLLQLTFLVGEGVCVIGKLKKLCGSLSNFWEFCMAESMLFFYFASAL